MNCLHPIEVRQWAGDDVKYKTNSFHLVPCGKCIACLSRRRNDWSFRLQKEQEHSSYSFFLTLTYDDQNIPLKIQDNKPYFVFNKKHIQDYLKRVRHFGSKMNLNIRYYCVSEYGSKIHRPHYHMQLFVKNDNLLQAQKQISDVLRKEWIFGFCTVKPTDSANIHYVTKYCLKSLEEKYDDCIDDVFILASKNPYIGYEAEKTLEKQPYEIPMVFNNGCKQAMPRIFRNKLGFSGFASKMSEEDPRFSFNLYLNLKRSFLSLNPFADLKNNEFDAKAFALFCERRLKDFEDEHIRRNLTRLEKL